MELHLNEILVEKNISVNQLHKMTEISRTTLDPLSKAKIVPAKTRIDTLNRIAEALNINLNELISFSKINEREFNIELHESMKHNYTAYENSFEDRLLLKINQGKKFFYAYVAVSYRPLDIFLKKNEKLIEALDCIVDDYKHGEEMDNRFDEISNFLNNEAMLYKGKFKFNENSFRIYDFIEINKEQTNFNQIPLDNISSMRKFLTYDHFLMSISDWLSNYYDLKNQISLVDRTPDYKLLKVDYFTLNFHTLFTNPKISVEYKFKID